MATTTIRRVNPFTANSLRRLVFMYVGPGKRRQWADRLGSPGRRTSYPIRAISGFLSVFFSLLVFYLAGRISTYGAFWREGHEAGAWGGPTLTGAWLTHAALAIPAVALILWLLVPITNLIIRGLR